MAQSGQGHRFGQQPGACLVQMRRGVRLNDFERNLPVELGIVCDKDLSHAACTDLVQDHETVDLECGSRLAAEEPLCHRGKHQPIRDTVSDGLRGGLFGGAHALLRGFAALMIVTPEPPSVSSGSPVA